MKRSQLMKKLAGRIKTHNNISKSKMRKLYLRQAIRRSLYRWFMREYSLNIWSHGAYNDTISYGIHRVSLPNLPAKGDLIIFDSANTNYEVEVIYRKFEDKVNAEMIYCSLIRRFPCGK